MLKYHPTTKSISSRRSISTFDSAKLSTISAQQLPKQSKLLAIKSRNNSQDFTVTGEVAAKVVKNYLLPMFESETRKKSDTDRQKTYCTSRRASLSVVKGTVYEDLKLIETLSDQIHSLKQKIQVSERDACNYFQEKYTLLSEIDESKSKMINYSSTIKFLAYENLLLSKAAETSKSALSFSQSNSIKVNSELINENQHLKQEIQEIKSLNDIRL